MRRKSNRQKAGIEKDWNCSCRQTLKKVFEWTGMDKGGQNG